MRETVVRAKEAKLPFISDVALLKRLRKSSEWFRWMSVELLKRRGVNIEPPSWLSGYQVRSIDACVITEPGSTGSNWRLHYSIKLFGLQCDQFLISLPKIGESFLNFRVNDGDLLIGDRAYGRIKGLMHVKDHGGEFLVRFRNKSFTLYSESEEEIKLLDNLRKLSYGEIGDWPLVTKVSDRNNKNLPLRICAIKKSEKEAEEAVKKALQEAKKKQRKVNRETLEMHRYVILVTSLFKGIEGHQIMELYRNRWQIEIAFKRLKSIMGLGHLPKKDENSASAWLHGKLFVALLVQAIIDEGRFFSPWGYPI